jgi:ABC-type Mn2+/Zn2+ transport system permease subunit
MSDLSAGLIASCAIGSACAVLSVFVVLRRWAFVGEGIAHAGFGGAGTAWLAALVFPGVFRDNPALTFGVAMLFCLAVALTIAALTRRQLLHMDTVVGIFLVTSIAWGFVAAGIYTQVTDGRMPPNWEDYLIGRPVAPRFAAGAVSFSAAVLAICCVFGRELLACSFDPVLAQVSGVRVGVIHYLLVLLIAFTIIVGMPLVGSLLVAALLILPGAIALLVSRRMVSVVAIAVTAALVATSLGPLVNSQWPFVRVGPAIVLTLAIEFALVYAWARVRRSAPGVE